MWHEEECNWLWWNQKRPNLGNNALTSLLWREIDWSDRRLPVDRKSSNLGHETFGNRLKIVHVTQTIVNVWRFRRPTSQIERLSVPSLRTIELASDKRCQAVDFLFEGHRSMNTDFSFVQFESFRVGMVSTLKHIYSENGIVRGLYRGMSINYLRAIPMVAVSFSTYEVLKQALNLDTGMKI